MNTLEATPGILGLVDVASRTLGQLSRYISLWASAPSEVIRLRDSTFSLRQLLENAYRAGSVNHYTLITELFPGVPRPLQIANLRETVTAGNML